MIGIIFNIILTGESFSPGNKGRQATEIKELCGFFARIPANDTNSSTLSGQVPESETLCEWTRCGVTLTSQLIQSATLLLTKAAMVWFR
jgi:hypothetical protein